MSRILVIDDEEIMRDLLRDMLESEGHEVICASDGKEGLELYSEISPDLVITDIVMPEKDGITVVWEIRAHYPDAKLIVITGYDRGALPIAEDLGVARTLF